MKLSFTEENYIKALYHLDKDENAVSTNALSYTIGTKASTVTDMIKKLADKKLINYLKYQGVKLTEIGVREAVLLIRKHRLWEVFLVRHLGFKWDEIHIFAEELEHIGSNELINRLEVFLQFPKYDPHGDPIPDKDGNFPENSFLQLSSIQDFKTYKLAAVSEDDASFLQYLDKMQLKIGSLIEILERNNFDDSIDIKIDRKKSVTISQKVAELIFIEKI